MVGFIVNPVAGNGKGKRIWERIEPAVSGLGAVFVVRETSGDGSAEKLAKEMIEKEGVNKIIAVGGDGTVHGVLNGIYQSGQSCKFGLVPAGSGNDFARAHGIATNPVVAVERVLSETAEKRIDLMWMNGRVAANSIGAGFDAQVARATDQAKYKAWLNRWRLGGLAYVISVLRELRKFQRSNLVMQVDGQVIKMEAAWLVTAANIPNYGGGMKICPMAVANDGWADICVVSNASCGELLRAFAKIYFGSHIHHPKVSFYRGRQITIETVRPYLVHADGELVGETPIEMKMLPDQQAIFV
ncbi:MULTISPECIES: diacylglycerol/lipid kinase family protein [Brevibacillus]|uniref:Diacylglycerol kinase n=1 Tax=Brevibacillus parabrevis TaxID=54914 RepID=A0A4Y3PLP9_BREPA|nr:MULTISPECIES: diacylglycerol kinase family protein [Brevibacillus]MBU8713180.1 diacylglycerol kinase family lipid kinase [Brevibacillus parabrevis]MDR4997369.1 diacylglycerol kinase family lipid kinase [Brevibacillus parabrevis]MED2255678.1 diacylglycerol kinase family lipid kinase [Brevibacillus parabrevis]NRQ55057.1 diacylglycerol kinase family lipid kinase [Brevibacillus sp. HD1.4A]RNB97391.1 diacylglycerol kinase family lipid kinase [Brevibacillus parabrevis]